MGFHSYTIYFRMDNAFSIIPFYQLFPSKGFLLLHLLCNSSPFSLDKGINYHNIPPLAMVLEQEEVWSVQRAGVSF